MFRNDGQIRALILGCRQNNRDAQQGLYNLLIGFAMGICERYAGTQMEAEELAQEGFVKLFRHIDRFDMQRQADLLPMLKAWFKIILVNTCIDEYRRNKRQAITKYVPENLDIPENNQASAVDHLSYKELIQATRLLSPSYRQVFNMYIIDGLNHEEIARELGISVGTSKSNLSKAREKMKKILATLNSIKNYV